ncbi:MAG: NADH-quinone oxidoreductase subunit J [Candidatus Poseidoniaceae archaeon]|jgi:NADH:ubiquinone oxidoreductase subunit 6 (subunit J)
MRLMSTLTRLGLIFLAGAMITVLGTAELWDEEPTTEIETIDLANTMLDDWALPLLVLGVLMAMAMIGAAYLVRDERRENLEWEQRGEDA